MGANASHYKARVSRVLLEPYQNAAARLVCPELARPRPGQYLQIYDPVDELDAVPHSVFASGLAETKTNEFDISGELPQSWQPGTRVLVRGPLGHGFNPPRSVRRLALAAISGGPGRLLPLIAQTRTAEVALFSDVEAEGLPLTVEQRNLEDLPSAFSWADFVAIDIAATELDELGSYVKLKQPLAKNVVAQALVRAEMPCGGLAQCGVCAISTSRGLRLACEDGPVFDLKELI
jgi:dihydroorotate dehydrogenase electron transfer subunit